MVAIKLLGRNFDVAPYTIGDMRKAAPFVTRINETVGALSTLDGAVEAAGDMIGFLSVGLVKLDDTLTPAYLEGQIGLGQAIELRDAMTAVVMASGLAPGEAPAPSEPEPQGA